MRCAAFAVLLLHLGFVCGCSGSPPESSFVAPPHGGNIVQVPDTNIIVELKTDRIAARNGSRKEPGKSRIVAYFYESSSSTPLSPAPSEVKISLGASDAGAAVSLAAQSSEPGQFASEPGNYPDTLRGQIAFQHDGKPHEAKFSFR